MGKAVVSMDMIGLLVDLRKVSCVANISQKQIYKRQKARDGSSSVSARIRNARSVEMVIVGLWSRLRCLVLPFE